MLCCAFPAYMWVTFWRQCAGKALIIYVGLSSGTWGPKLGMRQMVISRYTFGWIFISFAFRHVAERSTSYYGVIVPCIMNLITMVGFSTLNSIVGGQALASVTSDNLSWSWVLPFLKDKRSALIICFVNRVGIVVIAVISLLVSFCGISVLNWWALLIQPLSMKRYKRVMPRYERVSWIPVVITFVVALGVGGKHLSNPPPFSPATGPTILSFGATLAGFSITYSGIACDFSSYYRPNVSRWAPLFLQCNWMAYFNDTKLENVFLGIYRIFDTPCTFFRK